jgi:hypothetical protein
MLILMYRRRSGIALSNTYPAKSKLAAPATFVIVDNARITRPSLHNDLSLGCPSRARRRQKPQN